MNFEQNVCKQIPHLRRYAQSLTNDSVAAEDLVQDCLERALRKRLLWRRSGNVRAWLFRMLYRIFLNHRSSAATRREVSSTNPGEDLHVTADHDAQLLCRDAASAIERLPVEQRAALMLIVLENPSYEEAADILGIKVGTLRSRLSRAREFVREYCQPADRAPRTASAVSGSEGAMLRRVK
ncbi:MULTISPECIES: RNA polymerase sigma factor [Microbulbifer]|uniref:RNA polymerase sigma factor n=1 Tax=Microbulbifer celer TaxID=435905 RepID=A0ABW3UBJ1_9GAMM|nr:MULTISPECIES: sigma-70 family RNA polymerase sigma factor [Microbulbifer]UFN57399.1 sigma-70 family RNA polymerase sigma factor [Microbulbifer celer]